MNERREHQRHKLRGDCFVRNADIIGGIIDLSMGGVACSCFCPESEAGHFGSCENIDIFCAEDKLCVEELGIKVVDSEKTPGEFLANFWVIKCRARFDNLRDEQCVQLATLINTHTPNPPYVSQ